MGKVSCSPAPDAARAQAHIQLGKVEINVERRVEREPSVEDPIPSKLAEP